MASGTNTNDPSTSKSVRMRKPPLATSGIHFGVWICMLSFWNCITLLWNCNSFIWNWTASFWSYVPPFLIWIETFWIWSSPFWIWMTAIWIWTSLVWIWMEKGVDPQTALRQTLTRQLLKNKRSSCLEPRLWVRVPSRRRNIAIYHETWPAGADNRSSAGAGGEQTEAENGCPMDPGQPDGEPPGGGTRVQVAPAATEQDRIMEPLS